MHPGVLFRCQKNDAVTHERTDVSIRRLPSYIYRTIRQAAPGHNPLRINVKGSSVFMLEHRRGYLLGSSHHGCFIESRPSHQGSTGSFETRRELSLHVKHPKTWLCVFCFLKDIVGVISHFRRTIIILYAI